MDDHGFELAGDRRGILCLHGFTGTPFDFRYVGEALAARGPTVVGLTLPGHGTTVEDLDAQPWSAWADAVVAAYDRLTARCRQVAVVGQSMGGLLALHLATLRRPAAVASLAAPLRLSGLSGMVAHATTRWPLAGRVRRLPKRGGSDVREPTARHGTPSYPTIPVRALGQLLALMRVVDAELPAVTAPLLIVHGVHDHTAPADSAARIARRVATLDQRVVLLPASYHVLSLDVERERVAAEVGDFFLRRLGPAT